MLQHNSKIIEKTVCALAVTKNKYKLVLQPDVCQTAAKMLWIHDPVDVRYFAECHENRQLTVCVRNAKIPYSAMVR